VEAGVGSELGAVVVVEVAIFAKADGAVGVVVFGRAIGAGIMDGGDVAAFLLEPVEGAGA
jgi:hypothetical protein